MKDETRVGVVGLGNMGVGMAANLIDAGFPVVVRDIRPEPVSDLVAMGATEATSIVDLAESSDVVCVAVFTEDQVRATLLGSDDSTGLFANLATGSTVCVHSTVSPQFMIEMSSVASRHGVSLLDVAMSGGGAAAARDGQLSFIVGGDAHVVEAIRPVLEAMSVVVHHAGPTGTGMTAKIINNMLAYENVLAVRNALRVSRALGIEDDDILRVVSTAVGASWSSDHWAQISAQDDDYTTGKAGMIEMASKDLCMGLELAHQVGVDTPVLSLIVDRVLPDILESGGGLTS